MQKFVSLTAIVLIIVGIVLLSYTGFTYNTEEKIAEVGSLKLISEEKQTIPFSPVAGGICLALGIGLIVFNRMRR